MADTFSSSEDAAVKLLETAAKMMEKAAIACETNQIEERTDWCDKVIVIFGHIESALERDTPEKEQAAKAFGSFTQIIGSYILQVNLHNDPKLARVLAMQIRNANTHLKVLTAA